MIIVEPLIHRGILCIAIREKYDSRVLALIRSIPELAYSSTHRCFYGKYCRELLELLSEKFLPLDPMLENRWEGKQMTGEQRRYFLRQSISIPDSYRDHLIKRRYSKSTCDNYEA